MKPALVAVALLVAVAGCGGKKTTGPDQNTIPTYAVPSTPSLVLRNLELAYSRRDTTEYDSLFDDNYTGTSTEYDSGVSEVLDFTKADETAHIRALKRSTSISMIRLQFPSTLQWYTDGFDPPGWATIGITYLTLTIDDNPSSFNVSPTVLMAFKFSPTAPATSSPTDTTWKIIRWTELRLPPF